jgi:hypothetical protein
VNSTIEITIKQILSEKELCPCILLGKYVAEFKKIYKGKIFSAYKLEDVKYIVNNYLGMSDLDDRYFVIDGIGFLSAIGQNALLKFIEESKLPIILLSYYDKVSPIILSRIKFVFKKPTKEVTNLKFSRVRDALSIIDEKKKSDTDFSDMEEIKFYAENCPPAFVLKYSAGDYDYSSQKILRLLSKI